MRTSCPAGEVVGLGSHGSCPCSGKSFGRSRPIVPPVRRRPRPTPTPRTITVVHTHSVPRLRYHTGRPTVEDSHSGYSPPVPAPWTGRLRRGRTRFRRFPSSKLSRFFVCDDFLRARGTWKLPRGSGSVVGSPGGVGVVGGSDVRSHPGPRTRGQRQRRSCHTLPPGRNDHQDCLPHTGDTTNAVVDRRLLVTHSWKTHAGRSRRCLVRITPRPGSGPDR